MIKITYGQLGRRAFHETLRKLGRAETANRVASKIHYLLKGVNAAMAQMGKDYMVEVQEKFAEVDEAGKVKNVEGSDDFVTKSGSEKAREEAEKAFNLKEAEIDREPLNQFDCQEIRLSAFDLQELAGLYTELETPSKVQADVRKLRQ